MSEPVEPRDPEGFDADEECPWDCDLGQPEWTDGDDARVEREGY